MQTMLVRLPAVAAELLRRVSRASIVRASIRAEERFCFRSCRGEFRVSCESPSFREDAIMSGFVALRTQEGLLLSGRRQGGGGIVLFSSEAKAKIPPLE
jgi:hypothetical protein